jgi:DNA-directed RNA polymerase subunit omega
MPYQKRRGYFIQVFLRKVIKVIYPSIDEMLKNIDSRYSLVILAAKRARQLREGQVARDDSSTFKEVTSALEDISSGRISFERTKNGIK